MSERGSSPRDSTFYGVDYDDEMKPMGRFGAPKCRWTNSVIALCVSLTGLVLLGIGACMALFFANEELALAFGIILVILGFLLLVGGGGYYGIKYMCGDQFKHFAHRHGWSEPVIREDDVSMPQQVFQPSDERSMPLPADASQTDAPPTYDSIQRASPALLDTAQSLPNSFSRPQLQFAGSTLHSTGALVHPHVQQPLMHPAEMQAPRLRHQTSPQLYRLASPPRNSFGSVQQTDV